MGTFGDGDGGLVGGAENPAIGTAFRSIQTSWRPCFSSHHRLS